MFIKTGDIYASEFNLNGETLQPVKNLSRKNFKIMLNNHWKSATPPCYGKEKVILKRIRKVKYGKITILHAEIESNFAIRPMNPNSETVSFRHNSILLYQSKAKKNRLKLCIFVAFDLVVDVKHYSWYLLTQSRCVHWYRSKNPG
jgi:hypothetical protein